MILSFLMFDGFCDQRICGARNRRPWYEKIAAILQHSSDVKNHCTIIISCKTTSVVNERLCLSHFPLGDAECEEHGNCCPDFQQHCRKEMEQIKDTNFGSGTSCAIIGCGKFLSGKPCTLATRKEWMAGDPR